MLSLGTNVSIAGAHGALNFLKGSPDGGRNHSGLVESQNDRPFTPKNVPTPWQHCVLTWLLVAPAQGLETIDTLMQAVKSFMEVGQGLSYMPPNLNLQCNLRLEYFRPHFMQVKCETQEGLATS